MNRKQQAIAMRHEGWAYSDISNRLKVPKSTLSGWLSNVSYSPNAEVVARLKRGRGAYGLVRHAQRMEDVNLMKRLGERDIGGLSHRDLWMVGIGLWLGEGSKTAEQIRLVNSNPDIIRLSMRWLREVCNLATTLLSRCTYTQILVRLPVLSIGLV